MSIRTSRANARYIPNIYLQGAIILDTVFNYDPNGGSQDIPSQWLTAIPDKAKKIKYNEQKGDFLALIGRNNPEEIKMSSIIRKWSSTLGGFLKTEDFILKKLPPKIMPSIRLFICFSPKHYDSQCESQKMQKH